MRAKLITIRISGCDWNDARALLKNGVEGVDVYTVRSLIKDGIHGRPATWEVVTEFVVLEPVARAHQIACNPTEGG